MPDSRSGHATVTLGAAHDIAQRLVQDGRYASISEACRAGLVRLEEERKVIDALIRMGEEGLASGINESFDLGAFLNDIDPGPQA